MSNIGFGGFCPVEESKQSRIVITENVDFLFYYNVEAYFG
jgi:hypothetical protein